MSALAWFEALTLASPVMYLLGLFLRIRRRLRLEARARSERSVAAIAARIEREQRQTEPRVRWPRADPDRGAVRDDRPTAVLPNRQVSRSAATSGRGTVPLRGSKNHRSPYQS